MQQIIDLGEVSIPYSGEVEIEVDEPTTVFVKPSCGCIVPKETTLYVVDKKKIKFSITVKNGSGTQQQKSINLYTPSKLNPNANEYLGTIKLLYK